MEIGPNARSKSSLADHNENLQLQLLATFRENLGGKEREKEKKDRKWNGK